MVSTRSWRWFQIKSQIVLFLDCKKQIARRIQFGSSHQHFCPIGQRLNLGSFQKIPLGSSELLPIRGFPLQQVKKTSCEQVTMSCQEQQLQKSLNEWFARGTIFILLWSEETFSRFLEVGFPQSVLTQQVLVDY